MLKYKHAIRDPIHSYIRLTDEEKDLLSTPFLQRLRWISQLSGVRMVFPGAMHSRLSHVLGVAQLAGEYSEQIYQEEDDLEFRVQVTRLGGLLHDIAHGPFSHAYDDTVYRDIYPDNPHGHDTHRFKIVQSDFLKPYIEACGIDIVDLISLWKGEDPVMQAITQGALGADRMDFMLRDAYYSGTTHFGSIESKRIIDNALIYEHNGTQSLHYNLKALEDIFQSLLGRFFMYRGVYFHKASAAADILIRKLLDASKGPLNLASRTENLESYQWINEYTIIGEIMSSTSEELEQARYYTKRLMSRQLPKLVWETTMSESQIKTISGNLEKDAHTIAKGRVMDKIFEEARRKKVAKPELYMINTYPMSTIDNQEFEVGKIFIYDRKGVLGGKSSYTLRHAMEKTAYFSSFLSQIPTSRERYVMVRVFTDEKDAGWIKKFIFKQLHEDIPSIAETSY